MTEEGKDPNTPKIIIDSDWKKEAAREKERLAEETKKAAERGPLPEPSLTEIVNMIVMQASIGLGGYKAPTGETLPPDLAVAKHYIDLLDLLRQKTAGQTTDEETKLLESVLHEMRMHYVQAVSAGPGAPPKPTE